MPDKDASTPRVFIARHGETTWSQSGNYTGMTDIPLTPHGEQQVISTGRMLVGKGKLIDPAKVVKIVVSPRKRARRTVELLGLDKEEERDGKLEVTEEIAEWGYGKYEGLLVDDIRQGRKERGLDRESKWDIWKDGCEGGENPEQVAKRMDGVIGRIRELQKGAMHGEKSADVLVVAHGHSLRAFVKRWLGYPLEFPLSMQIEPGGIGILSYSHHNIGEPCFLVGMAIPLASQQ